MGLLDGEIAEIVDDALADIFLDATLTRDGANSGTAYDPVIGTPTTYTCKAIVEEYGSGVRGQGLVGAKDIKVLILANSLAVEPQALDRISVPSKGVSGVVHDGNEGMKAVVGDPATATWECRVVT